MDDILICNVTRDGIKDKTSKVLEILKKNDLYLKPEKCVFKATHIEYLGYVIEEGQVMMDPVKVKGIVDWPAPTTLRQLRSFLSFCNYYRKFIKKYSDKCCELLQKEEPWRWTDERHQAFEMLKQEFTKEPVLRMPDQTLAFQIEADTSKYASGAVLTQEDKFGE